VTADSYMFRFVRDVSNRRRNSLSHATFDPIDKLFDTSGVGRKLKQTHTYVIPLRVGSLLISECLEPIEDERQDVTPPELLGHTGARLPNVQILPFTKTKE